MGKGGSGKGFLPHWIKEAANSWQEERRKREEEEEERHGRNREDIERVIDARFAAQGKTHGTSQAEAAAPSGTLDATSLRGMVRKEARKLLYNASDTTDDPPPKTSKKDIRDEIKAELMRRKKKKKKNKAQSSDSDDTGGDRDRMEELKADSAKRDKSKKDNKKNKKASKPSSTPASSSQSAKLVLPIVQRKTAEGKTEDMRWNLCMAIGVTAEVPVECANDGEWKRLFLACRRVTLPALKELVNNLGLETSGTKAELLDRAIEFTLEQL
eukprot:TRINITY_DN35642_c0_g1_i1.p2 TRINITY_DN35642_c0_g1~~TRINITY_DN35642_c0_g1_i1.p2  ORF type:complete len:270 (-),score=83.97 TRINITY_DN35642_c0_g1_i1:941-1750(-)